MKRLKDIFKKLSLATASSLLVIIFPISSVKAAANTSDFDKHNSSYSSDKGGEYAYNRHTGLWENDNYTWNPDTQQAIAKSKSSNDKAEPGTSVEADRSKDKTSPTNQSASKDSTESSGQVKTGLDKESANASDGTSVNNQLTSKAYTGDAVVKENTEAGDAKSGNAQVTSNLLNMVQSSATLLGPSPATVFTSDIYGDVSGDMYIDPSQLTSLGNVKSDSNNSLQLGINKDGVIDNEINLEAGSGNVELSGNTSAGDASSGSANAVANVVNLLNSYISAGQSFIGNVNIYGNLNGDILFPPNALNSLLASNVPRTTINSSAVNSASVMASSASSQAINNQVRLAAESGNVRLSGNTSAGDASSGNASTGITVLNLTGSQTIGSDALLVFVNVLGSWVGMIVGAPGGTTAAAFGGNASSSNSYSASLNNSQKSIINNDISVKSKSGDTAVTGNTMSGSATSGKATASANIANIVDTKLDLTNWFGLLFINVYGSWEGSFGINTLAGNPATISQNTAANPNKISESQVQTFSFVPSRVPSAGSTGSGPSLITKSNTSQPYRTAVLPAVYYKPLQPVNAETEKITPTHKSGSNLSYAPLFAGFAGLAVLGRDNIYGPKSNKKTK